MGLGPDVYNYIRRAAFPGTDERGPLARIADRGLLVRIDHRGHLARIDDRGHLARIRAHFQPDRSQRIYALVPSSPLNIQTMAIPETLCTIQLLLGYSEYTLV